MATPLRNVRSLVRSRQEFEGNSIYAQWRTASNGQRLYVVFSYGVHWPLFVWHDGKWYANGDKFSVTTTKHKTLADPREGADELNLQQMQDLVHSGDPPPPAGIRRLLAISP